MKENTFNESNDNIENVQILENLKNEPSEKQQSNVLLKRPKKSSELMLRKTMRHIKKTNKLHRYKIGLIFYIIYIIVNLIDLITTIIFKFDLDFDPFCETYARFSAFTIFIFVSPFLNKTNSSKLFDIINITKYYIPDWKKKKNGNLSSVFYVF